MDLKALYEKEAARAYAFALRLTREPAAAEDAVAEAFCQLAEGRARAESGPELMSLVWRLAIGAWRSEQARARREEGYAVQRDRQGAGAPPSPGEAAETAELARAARSAMGLLSRDERAVIALSCELGLGPEEIARIVELPVETVRSHRRRGLDRLRSALAAAGLAAVAPAGLEAALAAGPVESLPASLATKIAGLLAGQASVNSSAAVAAKGGIAMKIVVGVVLAGALAGGAALFFGPPTAHRLPPTDLASPPAPPAPSGPAKVEHVAFCFGRENIDGPALEGSCADHKIWTVDAKGNQYVIGSSGTLAVRVVTTDGMVRTIAGDDRYLPSTGEEEGPAGMLPSALGGAWTSNGKAADVYLIVKGLPLEGEEKGYLYTVMSGYPCRIFKNKEKGGRWWYKTVGKGAAPLPVKAGDSVAFKDVNLKGVILGGEYFQKEGHLYSWDGENGKITCLLSPADYGDKCLAWNTGKAMGAAEQISISEDGTMYVDYYLKGSLRGQVFRISKDRGKVEEIVRDTPDGKDGPGMKSSFFGGPVNPVAYKDIVILGSVDSSNVRRWKDGRVSTLCEGDGEWREIYKVKGAKSPRGMAKGFACVPQLGYVYLFYCGEERGGTTGMHRFGPVDFLKPTVGPLVGGE